MFEIRIKNTENKYEYEELAKIFLRPEEFVVITDTEDSSGFDHQTETDFVKIEIDVETLRFDGCDSKELKNRVKHKLYTILSEKTGLKPDWGILTGVRPVKLAGELVKRHGKEKAYSLLRDDYLLTDKKARLLLDTYDLQQKTIGAPAPNSTGIYIGIPFCPTRCLYCSFTSNQKGPEEIAKYLTFLNREVRFLGDLMNERGYIPESIYMGGGTPTTITADEMDMLLKNVKDSFDMSSCKEFTVEAGRPDTITKEKLDVLVSHDINRISVNPQSMKARTLELIGRAHTPDDTRGAMKLARDAKIPIINMDIIAGLPEETPSDFCETLKEIIDYGAENITVHTLAVKRASRLIEQDPDFHYKQGEIVREMLSFADEYLRNAGYRPYYLYRQKHMAGSFENIGWCLPGTENIYNVRIMEEAQSIAALGAGGISKQYYPKENRLERIANVSNYEIYMERFDEMLERKKINLFT